MPSIDERLNRLFDTVHRQIRAQLPAVEKAVKENGEPATINLKVVTKQDESTGDLSITVESSTKLPGGRKAFKGRVEKGVLELFE